MRDYLAVLHLERLAHTVKRVVIALRCTYPEAKETAFSLELRMSRRVRYAQRRDLLLADGSKGVLYQLERIDRNPEAQ